IIGRPDSTWGPLFGQLAESVAEAPPLRPTPLGQDALLGLFKGEAVGRGVVLEPATLEDMCGGTIVTPPSLEVVYDDV
ncbi:MAG: chlorophyllide reductase iron protein subunit X, partial [Gammaproteobacteria bacterium]|nr:chlorophyllide reductase iron protein subunit X [Gammaproteobacteria bacterium]